MFNISQYLEKFKTLGAGDILAREVLATLITEKIGIKADRKQVKLQNGVLFVAVHPAVKNQIYIIIWSVKYWTECLK